jgi:uncharacterized protein
MDIRPILADGLAASIKARSSMRSVKLIKNLQCSVFASLFLMSCADAANGQSATLGKSAVHAQRGEGLPYEISDTEVWDVPDPASGRTYQIFVALPPSYGTHPQRR